MPQATLPELKSTYLNSLAKAGITKNAIVEDDLAYALMGYEKEGTIIKLKTKSLEEIQKFLYVKALGVTKSDTSLSYILSNQDVANYTKQAYDDAKAKAEAMAEKIGRKVGNVISLSNTNSNKISESLYYASEFQNREYYIAVSFELL